VDGAANDCKEPIVRDAAFVSNGRYVGASAIVGGLLGLIRTFPDPRVRARSI
jgi:hypothetical protein